jgi:polyhydroxyalkanoate synthesis regulator phasin
MWYLAQVHKNEFLEQRQLRLLARKEADNMWVIIPEEAFILLGKSSLLAEKLLVLIELSATGDINRIEEATNWVLNLVQTYLIKGVTPDSLQQEYDRAEQCRQHLTLQSQDLARRTLELEARREQIQALEESLKKDKGELSQEEQS